jgi:hypothetical protein
MKQTWKAQQGYKYYVYIGPGRIEYFDDLEAAEACAKDHDSEVKEMF